MKELGRLTGVIHRWEYEPIEADPRRYRTTVTIAVIAGEGFFSNQREIVLPVPEGNERDVHAAMYDKRTLEVVLRWK